MKKALTMLLTLLAALTLLAGTAIADDPVALRTTEFNDHDFFDTLLVLDPDASTNGFEVSVSIAGITDVENHVKTETLKKNTPDVTNLKEWNWTRTPNGKRIDTARYSRFGNQKVEYVSFETKAAKVDDTAAKNATIKVVYPYIGTYGCKKVGMELLITNIVPANYVWNPNTLWPARFQIAERPNYGIIMHNVHSADYDITLKYTDENTEEKLTDEIVEAKDLYLTWSSLSYYYERIFGGRNCFKEMVSPLTPVDYVYTVNASNISPNPVVGMGYSSRRDGTGNFVSEPLVEVTDNSNGYYAPFSGENEETNGNYYEDTVGHHTFPRNAVGFHFSNSAHMKTRVLSYANSMWFTLYPLGLTATTPNAPQGILLAASKEVAKKNETEKAQNSDTAIVTPGGEFEFVVSQKVNNLNYDSLIRYFSMQMAAVLPEEVDADTISCTLTNDQGEDIAANAVIMKNAKVNLNRSGEDWALLTKGDSNYDSSKEKNAVVANFKPDWLKNKDGMPLKGEQYYLTVKGKVKEGVADGVLTFHGVSSFNEKKTLVTEETCEVLDQNTRLELESLNDVFKYEITTRVPQDAVSLTITDTLADVLEFVGANVNSTASERIHKDGNTVTCEFADVTSDRGKPITLTITAKIKDGVTFQQLYDEYGVGKKETQIPNQAVASYQLKNNATTEINTNKVVVVPLAGLSLTKLVGDTFDTGNGTGVHPQVNSIPQAFQNDEFTFQVTLTDGQDQPLTGSYPLLINGADKGTITNGGTVKLKANQKFTIQKLPVGSKYSITETDIPKHWHKTTEANTAGVTVADTDAYIANALPLTSVSVSKVWDDANDQDGKRPVKITVTLNADGKARESVVLNEANGWKHTFGNLPAKDAGEDIKYTVTETLPEDYSMSQQGEGTDNVTITNKYTPGKTSVAVLKHWDDGHDQDGLRPASVTVELLADGVPTGKTLTLDAAGAWGGIFEDLDDMKDGQDIVYTVQETNVPTGYAATVTGSADTRFEITNTHAPEITQIDVTKVWDDNDDVAGKRPNQIIVKLHANGLEIDRRTVTAADEWKASFTDLPVYEKGEKVVYTITEDHVPGYTHEIDESNYIITNTYNPTKTNVEVEKTWEMGDHTEIEHPQSVIVHLLADGERIGRQVELSDTNKWHHIFKELDLMKDGKEIVYTVEEEVPAGYEAQVIEEGENDFEIVNTYVPKEPEPQPPTPEPEPEKFNYRITFTKEWRGDVGDHIDYTMYYPDGSIRVNRLPLKYKKSETEWVYEGYVSSPGEYYIIEDAMPGYKVRYENVTPYENVKDRCYNGGTIINYKVPKTGDTASPALWIGLAVLGLGGLGALTLRKRRKALR